MSDREDYDTEHVDYFVALKGLKESDFWDTAKAYSDRRCKALARRIAELEGKPDEGEPEQAEGDKPNQRPSRSNGPVSRFWSQMQRNAPEEK